jgi:phage-related protein
LTLESVGGQVNLRDYVDKTYTFSVAGATGFGVPQVSVQEFQGAGDGSVYGGTRVGAREVVMPLFLLGEDRDSLLRQMSKVVRTLDPRHAPARLTVGDVRRKNTFVDVVLKDFTDYVFGETTDGRTYLQCGLTLLAGDPYWTSEQYVDISAYGGVKSETSLLDPNSLAQLMLGNAGFYTECDVFNPGDAPAYPVWTVEGAASEVWIRNEQGDAIKWSGHIRKTETITIDTKRATIYDSLGHNLYSELAPVPRFFSRPYGHSKIWLFAHDGTRLAKVTGKFRPRYWVQL